MFENMWRLFYKSIIVFYNKNNKKDCNTIKYASYISMPIYHTCGLSSIKPHPSYRHESKAAATSLEPIGGILKSPPVLSVKEWNGVDPSIIHVTRRTFILRMHPLVLSSEVVTS